jgi:hypothetical protein
MKRGLDLRPAKVLFQAGAERVKKKTEPTFVFAVAPATGWPIPTTGGVVPGVRGSMFKLGRGRWDRQQMNPKSRDAITSSGTMPNWWPQ